MEKTLTNKRIDYIDLVKGIAIFLMIFAHCYEQLTDEIALNIGLSLVISSFHMPIFFIASGFLFNPKKVKSFGEFLKKLSKSILAPYASFTALDISFDFMQKIVLHNDSIDLANSIKDSLLQNHYNKLWFMMVLFFVQIAAYFVCKLKTKGILSVFALCIVLAFAYDRFVGVDLPLTIDLVPLGLSFFLIGYVIKNEELADKIFELKYLIVYIAIGTAAMVGNRYATGTLSISIAYTIFGNFALFYIAAVANSFALITICKAINKISFINYIGKYSLIFYGLHGLPLKVFNMTVFRFFDGSVARYFLITISATVISCVILWAVNEIIQRTPLRIFIGKPLRINKKIS